MKLNLSDLEHIVSATQNWGGRILIDQESKDLRQKSDQFLTVDLSVAVMRAHDLVLTSRVLANWESLPAAVCGVGVEVGDYFCDLSAFESLTRIFLTAKSFEKWNQLDLKPCLFLDRDNVVVPDVPYNGDPDKVSLKEGIVELIASAHKKGWWVVLVTNQSGLGRGRITWSQYREVHQRLQFLLAQQGQWFDDAQWAGFHETAKYLNGKLMPHMRKPRPGMFFEAHWKLGIDFKNSVVVGDSATDLIAGFRAGVQRLILLSSDKTAKEFTILSEFQKVDARFIFENKETLSIHL